MDKAQVQQALKSAKESSPKRNFKQTIDLIINLKGINLKKTDQVVNSFVNLHHTTGKKVSVCALVGAELKAHAKEVCDEVISDEALSKYKEKDAKKLADKHDYFIAQATIMPQIATVFGKVFGPRGKMPNPKAGCVVPPNANLKPLYDRLQKMIKIQTKNQPVIQCKVGIENQDEAEVIDNIITVHNSLMNVLPNGEHNIKESIIKLTMGPSFKIGGKPQVKESQKTKSEPDKEEKTKVEEKKPKEKKEPSKKKKEKEEAE